MSECDRFQPTFEAYVAGDLDEGALGPLLVHARGCEDCRRLLELHRDLAVLAARAPQPQEAELEAIEARVLRGIASGPGARIAALRPASRAAIGRLPRVAAALAAAVLLFAAGLAAGRAVPGGAARGAADVTERLVSAMRDDAAGNRGMTDVEDSRFTYSNVSFRRAGDGRLALDFDVTTRVQLVEPAGSELLQDLLVQALVGPSSTGTRLKAAELAAAAREPKAKEALLFAMRRDESLAVRLGALAALAGRLHDADVEAAMLATLRDDPAVQMRLLALDALAAHDADRDLVRQAIREGPRPGGEALEVRLAAYDQRL